MEPQKLDMVFSEIHSLDTEFPFLYTRSTLKRVFSISIQFLIIIQ